MLKYLMITSLIFASAFPALSVDEHCEAQSLQIFSLTNVPQDNLVVIASYGTVKDCIHLASVCKNFHDFLDRNPVIWQEYLGRIAGSTHPTLKGSKDEHPKDKFLRLMQPQFWLLTELNRDCTYRPIGISDNGLWVLGSETNLSKYDNGMNYEKAFILNLETEAIESLDVNFSNFPVAVTNDGEVFFSEEINCDNPLQASIWTSKTGKQPIKFLNDTIDNIQGISPNGRLVIGFSGEDFLMWDRKAETTKVLERGWWGWSISNNGVVIGDENRNLARYTSEKGVESLPFPENYIVGQLTAMTKDGSVCVGFVKNSTDSVAAMWNETENGKWQSTLLRCSEQKDHSDACDISDNGIVVGRSDDLQGFIWTQETGIISMHQLFGDRFPQDYETYTAKKITGDGIFILGEIYLNSNKFITPNTSEEFVNSSLYLVYIPDFKAYRAQGITLPFIKPFLRSN